MFLNYLTIAWRNLKKRFGPTVINVVGLSVGLAACLLIGLWVQYEFSYDDFHPESDRIYRVSVDARITNESIARITTTPWPMAPAFRTDVPGVESATRFAYLNSELIRVGNQSFAENRVAAADSVFFDVFGGFEMLHGSRTTALDASNAVVLTASTARRLFGRENVVGRSVNMGDRVCEVTGVMADVPETSHFEVDAVSRMVQPPEVFRDNWSGFSFHTYVKLTPDATLESMTSTFPALTEKYVAPQMMDRFELAQGEFVWEFVPRQITDIHLYANRSSIKAGGSIETIYVFSAIGLFILLIACVNFMNLATARASERATEVGMRKALGAGQPQLMGQFLGEAVLTTIIAMGIALGCALLALSSFNAVAGTAFGFGDVLSPSTLLLGIVLVGVVGLISGSYPAFALSRFAPAKVLKSSNPHGTGGQGRRLRQALVVFQFAVSIALIVGTLVAREQFDFIQSKRLGLTTERVVEIEQADELRGSQSTFVNRVRTVEGVTTAGMGDPIFQNIGINGFLPDPGTGRDMRAVKYVQVGPDFVETLGVEVVEGRSFERERRTDSTAVVINEAAAELLRWQDPVGHTISTGDSTQVYDVIGMVDDFHYESMRSRVKPLFLFLRDPVDSDDQPNSVFVRLDGTDVSGTLERLRTTWQETTQDPFQYAFLDQTYDALHRDVQRAGTLFSLFGGLAVVIACLGLFGLATYTVQRRSKEIGVRKALGATASQIVGLLSKEFLQLVGIAGVIALPVAFVVMRQWLSDFAYRTSLGVDVFAGALLLATLIAFVAVGYHAYRASQLDPARTLKDE